MYEAPDTIVLIHGFWLSPRSWEHWITHYERRGYRVCAPTVPGLDIEVDALNSDPAPIEAVTGATMLEHLDAIVRALPEPPILIGHSTGGAFAQLLLDRGLGAAGVVLNSAPAGDISIPQLDPELPIAQARGRAVRCDFEQWHALLTNTLPVDESRRLYHRYAVPVRSELLTRPAPPAVRIDHENPHRAPLLFVAATADRYLPPEIQWSAAARYRGADTVTEVVEFSGRPHLLPAAPGWQDIADYALSWALRHAPQHVQRRSSGLLRSCTN